MWHLPIPKKVRKFWITSSEYLPKFKKVIPYDYNRMLMAIVQMEEKGLSSRTGTDRSILCEYERLIVSREYEKKMEEISWENQPDLWIIKERHR